MLFNMLREIVRGGRNRVAGRSAIAPCPVCAGDAGILGEVDSNKSCEDRNGRPFPISHRNARYFLCDRCGFCFAPEFREWSDREFRERIYNAEYILADPEYAGARPARMAEFVDEAFGAVRDRLTHLDYGGGSGLTSRLLRARGWRSSSHDHFGEGLGNVARLSTYDLVTAWEVFEHAVDPRRLMTELSNVTHARSLILFSTLLSDGHIGRGMELDWWYLAPRNGHVSLYSRDSLALLLHGHGFNVHHLNDGTHIAYREPPEWAADLSIFRPD
jgi:hypothetical protein